MDAEGRLIGEVKDVSFVIGEAKMFMVIEMKDGNTKEIPWEEIQAAGDFVLLKPKHKIKAVAPAVTPTVPTAPTTPLCPTCGKTLTYIEQYKRWYCYNEKKYV
ncbi:MAG: PRC-barrel domain-containing protein [Nitrososphaerales archaeon]